MAAEFLRHHLELQGVEAVVRSAGTQGGVVDSDPDAIKVMAELGLAIHDHLPRRVNRELLSTDGADLIITMTNAHLREVALLSPDLFRRSFTAKEFVRRALAVNQFDASEVGLGALLTRLSEGRSARDLLGDRVADDVDDPYGQGLAPHRRTAQELDEMMATIARKLTL